jgi:DNA-binding transcriptional LysR family regulator
MDEFASIRVFVRVVECGSFAAAGRLLGVSKSVITKRVSQLENRLASQLLVRSTRRLTLTDAGTAYYERCTRILADLEDAHDEVSSRNRGLVGSLRVSCIASFTASQLSADLCQFQLAHPQLTLELHHNDRVYDPIQENYDVSIQTIDVQGGSIIRRPITTLRRVLVTTPEYLRKTGPITDPSQLLARRIAHNNFISPGSEIRMTGPDGPVDVPIRPTILSNSIWMIRDAVMHGECIGILPIYFVLDELCRGELVPVLPDHGVPAATLSAYYRRSAHVPIKLRTLLDFLVDRYRGNPPWEHALRTARPDLAETLLR